MFQLQFRPTWSALSWFMVHRRCTILAHKIQAAHPSKSTFEDNGLWPYEGRDDTVPISDVLVLTFALEVSEFQASHYDQLHWQISACTKTIFQL